MTQVVFLVRSSDHVYLVIITCFLNLFRTVQLGLFLYNASESTPSMGLCCRIELFIAVNPHCFGSPTNTPYGICLNNQQSNLISLGQHLLVCLAIQEMLAFDSSRKGLLVSKGMVAGKPLQDLRSRVQMSLLKFGCKPSKKIK